MEGRGRGGTPPAKFLKNPFLAPSPSTTTCRRGVLEPPVKHKTKATAAVSQFQSLHKKKRRTKASATPSPTTYAQTAPSQTILVDKLRSAGGGNLQGLLHGVGKKKFPSLATFPLLIKAFSKSTVMADRKDCNTLDSNLNELRERGKAVHWHELGNKSPTGR